MIPSEMGQPLPSPSFGLPRAPWSVRPSLRRRRSLSYLWRRPRPVSSLALLHRLPKLRKGEGEVSSASFNQWRVARSPQSAARRTIQTSAAAASNGEDADADADDVLVLRQEEGATVDSLSGEGRNNTGGSVTLLGKGRSVYHSESEACVSLCGGVIF